MPTLLPDVPPEILSQICRVLCPHCSSNVSPGEAPRRCDSTRQEGVAMLNNLSKTCRTLRDIAQPLLYHAIVPRKMANLLRTLMQRPDLAESVHFVSNSRHEQDATADIPVVKAAALRLGVDLPASISPENEGTDYGGEIAFEILLGYLPRLESLDYVLSGDFSPGSVLNLIGAGAPALTRLRYLQISSPHRRFDLGSCRGLLVRAPRLESLHSAEGCVGVSSLLPLARLKHLSVSNAFWTAEHLRNAIAACPVLEQFVYDMSGEPEEDVDVEFSPRDAWKALSARKGTLKHLHLNYVGGKQQHVLKKDGHFGSLADFHRLEELIVAPHYFDDSSNPPPNSPPDSSKLLASLPRDSLRVLGICNIWKVCFGSFTQLRDAMEMAEFPKLQRINVEVFDNDGTAIPMLVELFGPMGVEVKQSAAYSEKYHLTRLACSLI